MQLGDPCRQPRLTGSEGPDVIGFGAYGVGRAGGRRLRQCAAMIFGFPYTAEAEPLNMTLNGQDGQDGSPPTANLLHACTARKASSAGLTLPGTQVIRQELPIRASWYQSRTIIGRYALL